MDVSEHNEDAYCALGLDVGQTTGVCVAVLIPSLTTLTLMHSGNIDLRHRHLSNDLQLRVCLDIAKMIHHYSITRIVAELPIVDPKAGGAAHTQAVAKFIEMFIRHEFAPITYFIKPSQWKPVTGRVDYLSYQAEEWRKRKFTPHERDAARMLHWYMKHGV